MLSSKGMLNQNNQMGNKRNVGDDELRIGDDDLDDDCHSQSSVKTNNQVVLLWDLLKGRFRKSEEEEVARIIGTALIQQCEDLRDEYANFYEIYLEVQDSQMEASMKIQENIKKSSHLFSSGANAQFMNKELMFFVESLQKKAVDSGLDENSLIPKKDLKDKKIFEYIQNSVIAPGRPQSAATGRTSPKSSAISGMSNSLIRDLDPQIDPAGIDATMRTSFYSTRGEGFNKQKGGLVDTIKVKNVLELSEEDQEKIAQIRDFMKEQADGLQAEIDELQQLLMQSHDNQPSMPEIPSQKDLKDYSNKLQSEFLKSDEIIKVQKAMNLPKDHKKFVVKQDPLANLGTPGSVNKPPLKLANKGPIKVLPKGAIDKSSPQKEEGEAAKIVRMKVKRGSSTQIDSTQPTKRPPSGRAQLPQIDSSSGGALKLKLRTSSASRFQDKAQNLKPVDRKSTTELYGLDIGLLEGIGLGDIVNEINEDPIAGAGVKRLSPVKLPKKEIAQSSGQKQNEREGNLTYEELRSKYNIDNQHTTAGKLRGICKEYDKYYAEQTNDQKQ